MTAQPSSGSPDRKYAIANALLSPDHSCRTLHIDGTQLLVQQTSPHCAAAAEAAPPASQRIALRSSPHSVKCSAWTASSGVKSPASIGKKMLYSLRRRAPS